MKEEGVYRINVYEEVRCINESMCMKKESV